MSYNLILNYLLCAVLTIGLIPFTLTVLYKSELKQIIYLQLKQYQVLKVDNPALISSENNHKLVGMHGKVTVDEVLEDLDMGV